MWWGCYIYDLGLTCYDLLSSEAKLATKGICIAAWQFKIGRSQLAKGDTGPLCFSCYLTKTSVPHREKADSDVKLWRVKCGLATVCCFHTHDSCDNSNLFFLGPADE